MKPLYFILVVVIAALVIGGVFFYKTHIVPLQELAQIDVIVIFQDWDSIYMTRLGTTNFTKYSKSEAAAFLARANSNSKKHPVAFMFVDANKHYKKASPELIAEVQLFLNTNGFEKVIYSPQNENQKPPL